MTLRRATLYVAGGTLLVAWFSSAASMSLGRNSRRAAGRRDSAPAQNLAVSVQTQARRLKERLAVARCRRNPSGTPSRSGPRPKSGSRRLREPPCPCRRPHPSRWPSRTSRCCWSDWPNTAMATCWCNRGDQQPGERSDHGRRRRGHRRRYTVTPSIGGDAVEMKDGLHRAASDASFFRTRISRTSPGTRRSPRESREWLRSRGRSSRLGRRDVDVHGTPRPLAHGRARSWRCSRRPSRGWSRPRR